MHASEDLIELVQGLPEDVNAKVQREAEALYKQRTTLKKQVKENYDLQHDVDELDDKIKLLINNRTTLDEVLSSTSWRGGRSHAGSVVLRERKSSNLAEIQGVVKMDAQLKERYGNLFYYLQTRPEYLARLAGLLDKKIDIDCMMRTVVYSLFGDQYASREERLLLSLFKHLLQAEVKKVEAAWSSSTSAPAIGSFMRANTASTQMLSAYARRPGSMASLKDILEPVLIEILDSENHVSFEVKPMAIYKQLIMEHETETGETSPLDPKASDKQAAANPRVQARAAAAAAALEAAAKRVVDRLAEQVGAVPYGIRWVCKQLHALASAVFDKHDKNRAQRQTQHDSEASAAAVGESGSGANGASVSKQQIQSLVGGFVFLRYINPAIVTPDGNGLVAKKPNPLQRRNLMQLAKVLQNLSNGVAFGVKEPFMSPLNPFLDRCRPRVAAFFDALCDVDDLDDHLAVDLFTQHIEQGRRGPETLSLPVNEVFFMHRKLLYHVDSVCSDSEVTQGGSDGSSSGSSGSSADRNADPSDDRSSSSGSGRSGGSGGSSADPVRHLLLTLGPAPDDVPRPDNANISLALIRPKFADGNTVDTSAAEGGAGANTCASISAGVGAGGGAAEEGGDSGLQRNRGASVWERMRAHDASRAADSTTSLSSPSPSASSATIESAATLLVTMLRSFIVMDAGAGAGTCVGDGDDDGDASSDGSGGADAGPVASLMQRAWAAVSSDSGEGGQKQQQQQLRSECLRLAGCLRAIAESSSERSSESSSGQSSSSSGQTQLPPVTLDTNSQWEIVRVATIEQQALRRSHAQLVANRKRLQRAAADVSEHHEFLEEKLLIFKEYLDTVRDRTLRRASGDVGQYVRGSGMVAGCGGGSGGDATGASAGVVGTVGLADDVADDNVEANRNAGQEKLKRGGGLTAMMRRRLSKNRDKAKGKGAKGKSGKAMVERERERVTVKRSHKQLMDTGLIVASDVGASYQKLITFTFSESEETPGGYMVYAGVRGAPPLSLEIMLEDLLEQQQRGVTTMDVEEEIATLKLNINKIIHLINENFVK